ncbi:phage holin family protein [Gloeocapsa sp. PCC 73106]|uniref:phage holin family protein n=1 Tax=Gloeocapsa sp. PCC 73106 TaxID=102232 RepID=UPI0002ACDB77|nr:phage holin family protein [Gloeocapsa sp. PCC 73106]ELR98897.1 putative membrane protein [Gloeocapsa sp. PCC 73106]
MLNFLLTWLVATVALIITAYLVPGVAVTSFIGAAIASIVIGLVNATIKPILTILTLPLTILTLGLFLFVVNGIALSLAAYFTPGLSVSGFWPAVIGAVVLSIVSSLLGGFANEINN